MEAVAVKELTALLQQGSITLQMYAEGLAAIKTQKHHEACSYCYVVIRYDGQTEPSVEYRGPNAAAHVLKALQEEERKIIVLTNPKAMRMTKRTGGLITAPPPVMCVKKHLSVTLSVTTVTSP